jgi:hypothetical protein
MYYTKLVAALTVALSAHAIPSHASSDTLVLEPEHYAAESAMADPLHWSNVNARPCGAETLAVVHTKAGDQYTFCAGPLGTATMELLASGDASRSQIDRYDNPVALFDAVLPAGTVVPAALRGAIAEGRALTAKQRGDAPFTVGKRSYDFAAGSSAKAVCAAPPLNTNGFDAWDEFFGDSTYCGLVATHSASSNDTDWHQQTASNTFDAGGNEGSHNHAGPHYDFGDGVITYYADEDEDGGARFGRALVHSCVGTTHFRGWVKASPTTGSWGDPAAEFYVPQGELYVMRLYGNAQHSLWMGYDADDIRFRVDAVNGSSFGSRMYFAKYGWGPQCDINY